MLSNYELMVIYRPELTEENVKSESVKFEENLKELGGEIISKENWGKRKLAHEIDKCFDGNYLLTHFKSEAEAIQELARKLRINGQVLRYMFIKKTK